MKTIGAGFIFLIAVAGCGEREPAKEPSTATNASAMPAAGSEDARQPMAQSTTTTTANTTTPSAPTVGAHDAHDTTMPSSPSMRTTQTTQSTQSSPSTTTAPNAVAPTVGQAPVTDNPGKGDQTKQADNTKNNDRDRHGTLTPGDQGNSSSETKITADIRKGLMASKALSFTAKNAKVITTGTKVTLRGAVKSDAEKTEIERVAKSASGVTEVDNQLEVKK